VKIRWSVRQWLVFGVTVVLAASGLMAATAAYAAAGCQVGYTIGSQWTGGFGANVVVTNLGDPVNGWRLSWSFGAGQSVTQLWNGLYSQSGAQVTVTDAGWNASIPTGGTAAFGFNGSVTGANPVPSSFALNGVSCTGSATASPTAASPTPPSPTPPSPSASPSPSAEETLSFSSFDAAATFTNGGYTLYNNVFAGGSQFIWAYSTSHWGVNSSFPTSTAVAAYPNVTKLVNQRLSTLQSLTSTFTVLVPESGAYTTAYDIQADGGAHEIKLLMNRAGGVAPLGSLQTTATVGGSTWQVYLGSSGQSAVYSFLRTGSTTTGSVDILAVLNWLRGAGLLGDATVGGVKFGFEVTSCTAANFITTSFSVSSS
jgi:hypothetical protein